MFGSVDGDIGTFFRILNEIGNEIVRGNVARLVCAERDGSVIVCCAICRTGFGGRGRVGGGWGGGVCRERRATHGH